MFEIIFEIRLQKIWLSVSAAQLGCRVSSQSGDSPYYKSIKTKTKLFKLDLLKHLLIYLFFRSDHQLPCTALTTQNYNLREKGQGNRRDCKLYYKHCIENLEDSFIRYRYTLTE